MLYDEKDVIDPKVFVMKGDRDGGGGRRELEFERDDRLSGVVLADIDIDFWRLVWLMLKFMLASVPAVIAFMIIMFFVVNILSIGGLVALMAAFGGQ